jgi:holo-[acyl-carrier protein] synthase
MRVGIDIVEVKRIARLRNHPHFLKKFFSPAEIKYCLSKKNCGQHLAVRFAAKEAVWKCLPKKVGLARIEVRNNSDGQPQIYLAGKLCRRVRISLSHTRATAVAAAIYE